MARKQLRQLIAENAERQKGLDLITQFNKEQKKLLSVGDKIVANAEQTKKLSENNITF